MKFLAKSVLSRRHFLQTLGAAASTASLASSCSTPKHIASTIKPIEGSWISVWWDDRRHYYWNDDCLHFTQAQWQQLIKDMADAGMKYGVLLAIAKGGKAFYNTTLLPKLAATCDDPIEAMLAAADKYRMHFFISSDWYGDWDDAKMLSPDLVRKRMQMMEEIARLYSHHRSFYGWYWPNEAFLSPYFDDSFMRYANECSREAHILTPKAKTLTAPYGTNRALCDDRFIRQLEQLDVDIIAYQDEVGCLRMTPKESNAAFGKLRQAHDKVPQRALWADVEAFAWEGTPNRPESPLIPAPWPRIQQQLEAVSQHVDVTLIYQYQGLMTKPGTTAMTSHPDSIRLFNDYRKWLKNR